MNLNFKQFKLPQGITHTDFVELDIREGMSNIIYKCGDGVFALSLALKVFQSDGETDFTQEEVDYLQKMAETGGKPALIDGLRLQIENATTKEITTEV